VGSGGEIQESWMVQGFPNWGAYDMGWLDKKNTGGKVDLGGKWEAQFKIHCSLVSCRKFECKFLVGWSKSRTETLEKAKWEIQQGDGSWNGI
jgi:hypothetical protein